MPLIAGLPCEEFLRCAVKYPDFSFKCFRHWIKSGYFSAYSITGQKIFLCCKDAHETIQTKDATLYYCSSHSYDLTLAHIYRDSLLYNAIYGLHAPKEHSTGRYNWFLRFQLLLLTTCVLVAIKIQLMWLFCLVCLLRKIFLLSLTIFSDDSWSSIANKELSEQLPMYSILLPVYNEPSVVLQLIKAIADMHYPKERLDVKLLIEETDHSTLMALEDVILPRYFQIISIPDAIPRTKPKAMNYAMHFVRGDYLTVYDAEDIPEPKQLRLALLKFQELKEDYAVIQAMLLSYNREENWLTQCFAIEYEIWFRFFLPNIEKMGSLIPLGGSSNHFKVSILERVGLWDAFSVTEDLELSFRLHMHGYKIGILKSSTLEELASPVLPWIRQRTRWQKGYIKTFLDYFVVMHRQLRHGSFRGIASLYFICGFSFIGFLLSPVLLIIAILYWLQWYSVPWSLKWLMGLMLLYSILMTIQCIIVARREHCCSIVHSIMLAVIYPLYHTLHIISCYRAVWHLLVKPYYHWEKTPHGHSLPCHPR